MRFGFAWILVLITSLAACEAPETAPDEGAVELWPPTAEEVAEALAKPGEVVRGVARRIPRFPWPPPRASATAIIPAAFVRPSDVANPTLGDVDEQIRAALDAGGYFERSYFSVPGGFAMVTRLERINLDGTSKQEAAERWAVDAPIQSFSLGTYLRALFTAPVGYYRIIVFVVSSEPFAQAEATVERDAATAWLGAGLNVLPASIARSEYRDDHVVTALIYEFEQPGRQEPLLVLPGKLMGRVHLQRATLWDALGQ